MKTYSKDLPTRTTCCINAKANNNTLMSLLASAYGGYPYPIPATPGMFSPTLAAYAVGSGGPQAAAGATTSQILAQTGGPNGQTVRLNPVPASISLMSNIFTVAPATLPADHQTAAVFSALAARQNNGSSSGAFVPGAVTYNVLASTAQGGIPAPAEYWRNPQMYGPAARGGLARLSPILPVAATNLTYNCGCSRF
jgi:hypothetical protein